MSLMPRFAVQKRDTHPPVRVRVPEFQAVRLVHHLLTGGIEILIWHRFVPQYQSSGIGFQI